MQAVRVWQRPGLRGRESEQGVATAAEDDRLLEAGRAGDHAALEQLLARYEPDLLRLCRSALPNSGEAEDAVQETFLRFLRAYAAPSARFRGDASLRTWLFRIAVNLCLDWRRRDRRQGIPSSLSEAGTRDGLALPSASGPNPEEVIIDRLTVRAALMALPPRHRALLILREQEQWSSAEIAEVFHWNERKVRHELSKARETLARWREEERI